MFFTDVGWKPCISYYGSINILIDCLDGSIFIIKKKNNSQLTSSVSWLKKKHQNGSYKVFTPQCDATSCDVTPDWSVLLLWRSLLIREDDEWPLAPPPASPTSRQLHWKRILIGQLTDSGCILTGRSVFSVNMFDMNFETCSAQLLMFFFSCFKVKTERTQNCCYSESSIKSEPEPGASGKATEHSETKVLVQSWRNLRKYVSWLLCVFKSLHKRSEEPLWFLVLKTVDFL